MDDYGVGKRLNWEGIMNTVAIWRVPEDLWLKTMLSYLIPRGWTWDITPPIWMIHSFYKIFLRMLKPDWSLEFHGGHTYRKDGIRSKLSCAVKTLFSSVEEVIAQNENYCHHLWQFFCEQLSFLPSQSGRGDNNTKGDELKAHIVHCCLYGRVEGFSSFRSRKSGFQFNSTNYQLNNLFIYS